MENPIKKKIQNGDTVYGTMLDESRNPIIIPLLAKVGFDFVIVDCEHGTYSYYDLLQFILAAKDTKLAILVRPPGCDYISLAKVWDSGAHGIMVPRVETVEEVKGIIQNSKYPPVGARGYGARGIITDFDETPMNDKINHINTQTSIWLQIESQRAINTISNLISLKGIDGVIIGPADLSISLGIPGDFNHSKFDKAVETVLNACNDKNIPVGIHVRSLPLLKKWQSHGMRLLLYSTPYEMLKDKASEILTQLKDN